MALAASSCAKGRHSTAPTTIAKGIAIVFTVCRERAISSNVGVIIYLILLYKVAENTLHHGITLLGRLNSLERKARNKGAIAARIECCGGLV